LKDYPTLSYRKESFSSTILESLFRKAGLDPKPAFNDEITASSVVVSETNMVAIMFEMLDETEPRGFVSVPIEDVSKPVHTIYMAYKEKAFRSCVTDQLVDFTRKFATFSHGKIGTIGDYYRREKL
jgi:hypothetical protein